MKARRVHKRHLTHTQDTHFLSVGSHALTDLVELIRYTKEVWTIDLIYLGEWRDMQFLQVIAMQTKIGLLSRVDLIGERTNNGSFVGTFQEQDHRQQQAHLDGDGKVEDHRKDESHYHHYQIRLRSLRQSHHRRYARHVIAHHNQHTCQTSHRDHAHQRTKTEQHQQEHQRMHHARYRSTTAVVDISHRTSNSSSGWDTAKEWGHHIGYTLRYKLRIGVMLIAYHTVSHHRR